MSLYRCFYISIHVRECVEIYNRKRLRSRVSSAGNQKPMHQKARAWMWRTCVDARDRALSSIFFFLAIPATYTTSHKRIPPKTATSGPSEHPEAERRGEAADCARSTSFDLNVMRCTAKQYTWSVTHPPISGYGIAALATGNPPVILQCYASFRKYSLNSNRSTILNILHIMARIYFTRS